MKKFLLTLACVLGLGAWASATETTFDFTDPTAFGYDQPASSKGTEITDGVLTSGDITITIDFNEAATGGGRFRFYSSNGTTSDFRCSANGGKKNQTLTFASSKGELITKIEFTASKLNVTAAPTGLDSKTWSGSAESVVFTTSDACTITKIVVTSVEATADYVAAPTFSVKEGTYYEAQTVELAQADADAIYYTLDGTEPTAASTKYEAAIEVAKTTTIKAIAVKGENASEVAEATYTIAERAQANSIADAKLITEGEFVVNFPLTVGYAAYSNIFVTDGTDFIQIYKSGAGEGLKQGDVIPAGWNATYTLYSNATPELVPADALPAVTEGTFAAKEYEASDITADLVNSVVVIKNVNFAEATPSAASNFEGTSGDTTLTFRNSYKIDSVEAGNYNVEAVINIYSGAVQVYPISYTSLAETGVSAINADSNAAVEYFNLQGVRVANPENGIYVRRQGNKVSKVVIR